MKYKKLGETGLLVSELSFGTWITFSETGAISKEEQAYEIMKAAYQGGVNFFDNAELYANGEAEEIMGRALKLGVERKLWKRSDLVISTKLFFGAMPTKDSPKYMEYARRENRIGLSRKHIIEGMVESLERMGQKYCDLVFCHRFDPICNMEEVVRSFNYLIDQGLCFYWGTSEWTAQEIQEAKTVAARLNLIGPSFDQPQYNLMHREKVEVEFHRLYPDLGLTVWSPLAYGILTGKYRDGVPPDSRLAQEFFKNTREGEKLKRGVAGTEKLRPIAERLGCSLAQLALAWCMSNPNVSTTITGASRVEQVIENLKSVEFIDKLTPEVLAEIDEVFEKPQFQSGTTAGNSIRIKNLRHFP